MAAPASCHWVAYGISPTLTGFAEGETSKLTDKYVGGKSTQGVGFYSGPCTPPGKTPHHYTFVLVATDFAPNELPPGLTHDEVMAKIAPPGGPPVHAKGDAGMVGIVRQSMARISASGSFARRRDTVERAGR